MSTRLPGAKYKRVFDRGRSVKGRLLVAWRFSSPDADQQAGVVVSKKSFHEAVDRNRAKRLMREAFRLLVKEGALPEKTEWVFVGWLVWILDQTSRSEREREVGERKGGKRHTERGGGEERRGESTPKA